MYTTSDKCPRHNTCIHNGKGEVAMKDLATKEQMYNHASLFSHIVLAPGQSFGTHTHDQETEFYYILKGEGVFDDNGTKVTLHVGDVGITGNGEHHSLENCSNAPLEIIALIILK